MNKTTIYHAAFCLMLLFTSCKKKEGEGGFASVKGKITVQDWNNAFTIKNGEYAGADHEVYIIYGDDISYGERIRANHNGEFEFKYLRKGNYQVYAYSKDSTFTAQSGVVAVVRQISITEKKQSVTLDDIIVFD